jgi:hypothetical protein
MLKPFLFLIALLFSLPAFAQIDLPTKDGVIAYEGIIKVDSTQKAIDLYRKGREWFVNTYVDAKEVLQLDDKADGKLIGKGAYKYSFVNGINVSQVRLRFILNLDVKDGRYRYRIYTFSGENTNTSMLGGANATQLRTIDYDKSYEALKKGDRVKYNTKILEGLDTQVKVIVASLEKAMMAKGSKDDF